MSKVHPKRAAQPPPPPPRPPQKGLLVDHIPDDHIKNKAPELTKRVRGCLLVVSSVELALLSVSILFTVLWWETGYTWTLIVRSVGQLRVLFSISAICYKIPVINMVGTGKFFKIPKFLTPCPPLGIWAWIGHLDMFLIRIPFLVVDFIYFCVSGYFATLQSLFYIILGLVLIAESYLSISLIYYNGIRNGVVAEVIRPKGQGVISLLNHTSRTAMSYKNVSDMFLA